VNSTNFPVAVVMTSGTMGSSFETTANGGQINHTVTQSGGNGGTEPADAVFGTTSSCTTYLPWETEYYSASGTASGGQQSGYWTVWVQLPTLSASTNTTFYACWGNSGVTTLQNTGSYAPAKVWNSNYVAVYHLSAPGGTPSAVDSTSNGINGTNSGTTAQAGEIGGGIQSNASSEYIQLPTSSTLITSMNSSSFTISLWFNVTSFGTYLPGVAWGCNSQGTNHCNMLAVNLTGSGLNVVYGNGANACTQGTNPSIGSWYYAQWTQNGSAQTLYENASSVCSTTSTPPSDYTLAYSIGAYGASDFAGFVGYLDEVRIMSAPETTSQITAEYNNQKTGSTFLSWSLIA
jgi:hypothetical protein